MASKTLGGIFQANIFIWGRGYCVSTIGIDEQRIREYVQWQEKKEQEIEKLQGKLFDENEGEPVRAHLLVQKQERLLDSGKFCRINKCEKNLFLSEKSPARKNAR